MARLYADEDFDRNAVDELRRLGHDVLTIQEAGQANQRTPDEQVLAFASSASRAVVTFNRRHFIALHNDGRQHSGIVVCTRDPDAVALAQRIDTEVSQTGSLERQLLRITRPAKS